MQNSLSDSLESNSVTQPTAPLFVGKLSKKQLKAFPCHFFLVSGIGWDAWTPALEIEVTTETSREALWHIIVARHLDGRRFYAFSDEESFRADKLERVKLASELAIVQQQWRGWSAIENEPDDRPSQVSDENITQHNALRAI
jgi:hypothetical protein